MYTDDTSCYSAACTSGTRDQKRFTIASQVASDWYELMLMLCGHPLFKSANSWTRKAASRNRPTTPQSATLDLYPVAGKLLQIFHPAEGRRQSGLRYTACG